jgi:hypothetical protein
MRCKRRASCRTSVAASYPFRRAEDRDVFVDGLKRSGVTL